jgi:type I restriction enzyme S subunit
MKRWPIKPLGELISIKKGKKAPESFATPTKTSLRYLQIEDLRADANVKYCEPFICPKATKFDVIIAWDGANAGTVACNLEGHIGSTLAILRPVTPTALSAPFLSRFLEGNFDHLQKTATGATIPHISKSALSRLQLPVPPLAEQERIVKLLDEADELRKLRAQADRRTAALLPSLFHEMFGESVVSWKRWPVRSLGDLLTDGPQNGLYKHSSFYGKGTPILRIDAFYDGEVEDLTALKRLRATPDEIQRYGLRQHDIVINRVNSPEYLGKSALIPTLPEPTVFESNMMRFTVAADVVEPGYLIRFLQTPAAKRHILGRAKDSINQSSINQEDVKCLPVPLPPLPLQKEFAQRVAEIRELESGQAASRQRLEALFQSLLHRAFQGEL